MVGRKGLPLALETIQQNKARIREPNQSTSTRAALSPTTSEASPALLTPGTGTGGCAKQCQNQ